MLRNNRDKVNPNFKNNADSQPKSKKTRLPRGLTARDKATLLARWWTDDALAEAQSWIDGGCDPSDGPRESALACWLLKPRDVRPAMWIVGDLANEYLALATHAPSYLPRRYDDRIAGLRKASRYAAQAGLKGPEFVYAEVRRRCGLPA